MFENLLQTMKTNAERMSKTAFKVAFFTAAALGVMSLFIPITGAVVGAVFAGAVIGTLGNAIANPEVPESHEKPSQDRKPPRNTAVEKAREQAAAKEQAAAYEESLQPGPDQWKTQIQRSRDLSHSSSSAPER